MKLNSYQAPETELLSLDIYSVLCASEYGAGENFNGQEDISGDFIFE